MLRFIAELTELKLCLAEETKAMEKNELGL